MSEELIYSWIVTVDVPGAKASQVYNVAIREEHRAIEAVKVVLTERDKAVVKLGLRSRNSSLKPCACSRRRDAWRAQETSTLRSARSRATA